MARLHGEVKPGVKRTLMNGIELEDGPIKVDSFRIVDTYGDITTVEIVVHEGRNRQIRRCAKRSALRSAALSASPSAICRSTRSSRAARGAS